MKRGYGKSEYWKSRKQVVSDKIGFSGEYVYYSSKVPRTGIGPAHHCEYRMLSLRGLQSTS
jgi:hypothetical protein